eukprot:13224043-Alexandrium_andersonii.AAC.1
MVDAERDPLFRRYCGLLGRDPSLPKGQQSKAGQVAPWNWLNFDDRPPPRVEGRSLEEDTAELNRLIDFHVGSGFAAAPDIIDAWDLRL